MKPENNRPRAFVIDGDKARPFATPKARTKALDVKYSKTPEFERPVIVPQTHNSMNTKGFGWLAVLISALLALFTMGCALWLNNLIQAFFATSPLLGWMALTLAGLAATAAVALVLHEVLGLKRLRKIESIQDAAARALNLKDRASAEQAGIGFAELLSDRSEMTNAFNELAKSQTEFMEPDDRMKLADRILLQPLDTKAQEIISRQAKRVTLLTTVTPAAGLDILFVLAMNVSMLRQVSTLYGGRPSSLATLKLAKMIMVHLAIAGGLALSDTLIQQLVGRGLLGRLSARFGEGAINGILTVRVGLAAKAVCRPIPVDSSTRDDFVSILKKMAFVKQGNDQNATD